MTYFDHVRPTYIENWPAELCRLSVAQADVPLTPAEAHTLGLSMAEWGGAFADLPCPPGPGRGLAAIREHVRDAVSRFPAGAFVRLGSRSPKDCWDWVREGPRVRDTDPDPLRFVLGGSERMADDLRLALRENYAPHVFVRQWVDIEPWAELRCFCRGRRLIGISQYDHLHRRHFPELARHRELLRWAVCDGFWPDFRAASHLDNVVFDVFAVVRERRETRFAREMGVEIKLLEINPWGEVTDPCLFDWRGGGDFDGTFRTVGPDGSTVRG